MCRYAWHNYRDHFACSDCRKTFKYWQWEPIDQTTFKKRQRLRHVPREITCPDCQQPMVDRGLDFKAPRKNDTEAWEIIRAIYEHGFTFHGCGCYVGFIPPRKLSEVPQWIEEHGQRSAGEKLLDQFKARSSD